MHEDFLDMLQAVQRAGVWRALLDFGAPVTTFGITREDFCMPGTVTQVGQALRRIGLLTSATGLEFATAWQERLEVDLDGLVVPLLGRQSLIDNKRAVARRIWPMSTLCSARRRITTDA